MYTIVLISDYVTKTVITTVYKLVKLQAYEIFYIWLENLGQSIARNSRNGNHQD